MKSSNPALGTNVFSKELTSSGSSETMTVSGTVNKTLILTLLVFATAYYSWQAEMQALSYGGSGTSMLMMGGAIGGLIFAFITIFKKTWAPITAPIYALLEGLFLGGISAMFEYSMPGIAFQAVILTFGTLIIMLISYRAGWIKVTEKFRSGLIMATGAIALVYFISFIIEKNNCLVSYMVHFSRVNFTF